MRYLFKHITTHILRFDLRLVLRLDLRVFFGLTMSFLIYPHKFDTCHLHFGPAIQNQNQNTDNTVSKFSRVVYSTTCISLNSVGFALHLSDVRCDYPQHFNKLFVSYDATHPANADMISQLHAIECTMLNKYVQSIVGNERRCIYSITDNLNSGRIKVYIKQQWDDCVDMSMDYNGTAASASIPIVDDIGFNDGNSSKQIVLKIFGVWETPTECGITFKFMKL